MGVNLGGCVSAYVNAGGMGTRDERHEGNALAQVTPIYVGPPQRRLADKWQVFGYMRLMEYGPKSSAASAHFNPVVPGCIVKRLAVKTKETDSDVEGVGTCLRWRYDGNMLCTGYASGAIVIWDAKGRRLFGIRAGTAPVTAVAFSGNKRFWYDAEGAQTGCKLAIGDANGNINVFRLDNEIHYVVAYRQGAVVTEIDWRDHEVFTAATIDARIRIYDTAANISATIRDVVQSNPQFMEWGTTGRCLAITDNTALLKLYKPESQGMQGNVISLKAHTKNIVAASWQFGHNAKSVNKLCTIAMDKQLLIWDVANESVVTSVMLDQVPTTVAVNSADTFVAVGTYGNLIKVFNLPSLTLSCSFCDRDLPTSITWAACDEHIAYNVYNQQTTPVLPLATSASLTAD
ncbi:transducin beta-like protein 1 [Babesia caballi]|uniref:Transducin beta-like protein 1 n=1 Tax=Babesia caballi TaxID=5871 RepID=A0AAV4LMP6_BABCB|nr:transducin beta-like protein 1 [Babesia caballi]